MLLSIFNLNQRLLTEEEKRYMIIMICVYVLKNAYAMILVGTLFIMTPALCSIMKIPSFVLLAGQSGYSIYMMIKYYQAFDAPSDVQSLEEIYNLLWLVAYLAEYVVFLCMTISFVIALYNPPAVSLHSKWQEQEEAEK